MRYPDFIEELLLAKAYTELTADEKQQVGEWLTNEEEYTKIRELLVGIESAFGDDKDDEAPAHLKTTLEQAFTKKYKAKRMLTIRWQAVVMITVAASLALIFYVGSLFQHNQKPTEVAMNTPQKEETNTPNIVTKPSTPKVEKFENEELAATDNNNQVRESLESLSPPPAITELDIVEDDIEVDKEKYTKDRDIIATEKSGKKYIAVEEVAVQKMLPENASPAIQNIPKMSYTSPSTAINTDIYNGDVTSDRFYVLSSTSLAENTDLLELGVEVY